MEKNKEIVKPKRKFNKSPLKATFGMSNNFIFIVCVLIASLSWMLIKLSATYTVTYNFHLNYVDLPVDKNITSIADSSVSISFTDKGFTLLKLDLFSNMEQMRIKVQEYNLVNDKEDFYQISTNDVKKYLAEETGVNAGNILISKPYLGFVMESLYTKKVAVTEKHTIQLKEQYDLYGDVLVSPQKIKVFGPKNILDTIKNVFTESVNITSIDSVQTIKPRLINPLPGILRFEPEAVDLKIRVEKFTESSIEVPIGLGTVNDEITIFPKTVKISFKIAQKDFNNINAGLFTVIPETEGIDLNTINKLKLKISKKPAYIRDEWLVPSEVEFLIIKE